MQKFGIIRKKYAKKARGSQKKANFTEKITKKRVGGTPTLSISYAFYMTLAYKAI